MYSLLLAVIYLAFISLGLPDSALGAVWPTLHVELGVPISYAGILSMAVSAFTILSSLLSDRMTRKFGTGPVTAVSVLLTVIGLFGYSFSNSFFMMLAFAVPYGLGAGAVDAALNNYVALHYAARHMSWLHCFWGVGTVISPYILSYAIGKSHDWAVGYRIVGLIQIGIAAVLFTSLPLWRRAAKGFSKADGEAEAGPAITIGGALRLPGFLATVLGFFCYCSLESVSMLWASSYFTGVFAVTEDQAAALGSLVYIGVAVGRFASGFVSERLGDRRLIRVGLSVVGVGIVLIALPVDCRYFAVAGFLVVGLGCAPIYPAVIHATPERFGKRNSQALIGIQMAFSYVGYTLIPVVSGLVIGALGLRILPLFMLLFAGMVLAMTELVNRKLKHGEVQAK